MHGQASLNALRDASAAMRIAAVRNLVMSAGLRMHLQMECEMNRLMTTGMAGALMLSALTGCAHTTDPGQRTVGGALIGAGSGAAIGAAAGGPAGAVLGAAVGGVAGAATGYATTPPPPSQRPYYPPAPSGY
jgi:hypothetical protein